MNLNLYEELGINKNASKNDIREAFKNLSLKFHPDKNQDENTNKYIKIKNAYEILYNEKTRLEYDSINLNQSNLLYNFIQNIINNTDFNIFFEKNNKNNPKKYFELNIIETISCELEDRYFNKIQKLKIERNTKEHIFVEIPLCDNITIFKNYGEIDENNNIIGDLIINVKINNNSEYEYKEYDLIKYVHIPLYEYIYGGHIIIDHYDEIFEINHDGFINKKNNIIINNKGLPKTVGKNIRGDFIIYVKIENIEKPCFKDGIKNLCKKIYV